MKKMILALLLLFTVLTVFSACDLTGTGEGGILDAFGEVKGYLQDAGIIHTCTPGEWIIDKEPTCDEEGKRHNECTICGKKVSVETLEITDHTYETAWSANDYFHWHAATCGHDAVKSKGGHDFVDGICKYCRYIKADWTYTGETVESEVPVVNADWTEKSILLVSVNDCSEKNVLTSGGRAYLSGNSKTSSQSAVTSDAILGKVIARNSDAAAYTNTTVRYFYSETLWGKATDLIAANVTAGAAGAPDIYYHSVYDMVASSVKGYFVNLLGNPYFNGAGENAKEGYYREYMENLTFSAKAEYLAASEASVDISRNMFVLPVNMKVLLAYEDKFLTDRTSDGLLDENDLYDVIDKGEWTWDFISQLCEKVKPDWYYGVRYMDGGVIGMAIDANSGMSASALCYATDLSIVTRTVENGEYVYRYDPNGEALVNVAQALADTVANTDGFVLLSSYSGRNSSASAEIAAAFAADKVLIGNTILFGAIEQDTYRGMWDAENDGAGFILAPMPLCQIGSADSWDYVTVIHNTAKVFGVAANTKKADRSVAYVDYLSTHSSEILSDYFSWVLEEHEKANQSKTVTYVKNMSDNLGSYLDKTVDDALGAVGSDYASDDEIDFYNNRWHLLLRDGVTDKSNRAYAIGKDILPLYLDLYKAKEAAVKSIQNSFGVLAD